MRRREFITFIGSAAAAWPFSVRAQQTGKLPTIGFMVGGTSPTYGEWVSAFVERLRTHDWIERRTVAIEYAGQKEVMSVRLILRPNSSG